MTARLIERIRSVPPETIVATHGVPIPLVLPEAAMDQPTVRILLERPAIIVETLGEQTHLAQQEGATEPPVEPTLLVQRVANKHIN